MNVYYVPVTVISALHVFQLRTLWVNSINEIQELAGKEDRIQRMLSKVLIGKQ